MSLRSQLHMLNTSSDPAAAFTECLIVSIVWTDSKPAHEPLAHRRRPRRLRHDRGCTRRASAENVPLRAGEPWQTEASPAAASPAADDDRADDRADADMLEGARRAFAENVPLRAGEPWQAEGRR